MQLNEELLKIEKLLQKLKEKKLLADELSYLLENNRKYTSRLIEKWIKNKLLSQDDLKYLLNKINKHSDLSELSVNTYLIKHILNEFVLDKEIVDKLNAITKDLIERASWYYKNYNIQNIFDLIEHYNKGNKNAEELLELIELNKLLYAFDLNEDQKFEVAVLLIDNELAFNRLKYLIENQLEDNYSFETLMNYLKKKEKTNTLNI